MSFHLYVISEVYSNADGSVQYIELSTSAAGQHVLNGHTMTGTQGSRHAFVYLPRQPAKFGYRQHYGAYCHTRVCRPRSGDTGLHRFCSSATAWWISPASTASPMGRFQVARNRSTTAAPASPTRRRILPALRPSFQVTRSPAIQATTT